MKLLFVFLITVLLTICFGLRCHFCFGPNMIACDANSFEDECEAGMTDLYNRINQSEVAQESARAFFAARRGHASRTTGTQWCGKLHLVDQSPGFMRVCESRDNVVKGCKENTEGGELTIECYCNKEDLCNSGDANIPVKKTSGSGKPKLSSLTSWVVVVGFLSLAYL